MSDGIRAAVWTRLGALDRVSSVWGFGSYFRGENYGDVDILVVVTGEADAGLLSTCSAIRTELLEMGQLIGTPVHPLILTESEFECQPLRDMNELVGISG